MATPRPTGTFCWNELATRDPAAALAFYSALFGWRSTERDMGEAGIYAILSLGGADLGGMYQLAGPRFEGVPSHWLYYVSVSNADASVRRATELGGKVVMPAMDIPDVGRIAMLEDPVGAKFGVSQAGGHPGDTTDPMTSGAFGWVELQTRDCAAAKTFYSGLFGWEAKGDDAGPMAYTEWSLPNGKQFGGMIEMNEHFGDAPPNWMGYVMVDDTDAIVAQATALGARSVVPPTDIENVGRFAVQMDPQGACFAVMKLFPHHC